MSVSAKPHPFLPITGVRVVEAGPERAIVEHSPAPELYNHVGVWHASALYTGAHEAACALVRAALGEAAERCAVGAVAESKTDYKHFPVGPITTVATRGDGGWDALDGAAAGGGPADVAVAVVSTNEDGRVVMTVDAVVRAEPR